MGDAAESLIPLRSPTRDAMSEPAAAASPHLPPLVLAILIACIAGAAALTNCTLIAAIIKHAKNGVFSFIIQLCVADLMLLTLSIGPELWSHYTGTWDFGKSSCIAFRGFTAFASTASIYLVIAVALHTMATINLEEKIALQRSKRADAEEDEEMRSSRHSLVASSDKSTPPRTMNVDYRVPNTRVPIAPPTIFVWFLCTSLCIPEFMIATTIRLDNGLVCTVVESSHKINMHLMTDLFNFFLPVVIMTSSIVIIAQKLKSMKRHNFIQSVPALKLSLCLIVVYFIFCTPRFLFNMYGIYFTSASDERTNKAILSNYWLNLINSICSNLYIVSTLLRPISCITLLPRIRNKFTLGRERGVDHV